MTLYRKIARIDWNSGVEGHELGEIINNRMGSSGYKVLSYIHGDEYIVESVEEAEDADLEIVSTLEEVGGDFFGVTDNIASELNSGNSDGGEMRLVEWPISDRLLAWEFE